MRLVLITYKEEKKAAVDFSKLLQQKLKQKYSIESDRMDFRSIKDESIKDYEMVFSLSGDGVILYLAKIFAKRSIPIFSINFGNIGFITEFRPDNWEQYFTNYLEGNFNIKKRYMMEGFLHRNNEVIFSSPALNEFLIYSPNKKILNMEIKIMNQNLKYRVDGLIASTSTGSTGHALSAGGPIVLSELSSIIIVPIAPMYGAIRSLVFELSENLDMEMYLRKSFLTVDGHNEILLEDGDILKIKKYPFSLNLIEGENDIFRMLEKRFNSFGG